MEEGKKKKRSRKPRRKRMQMGNTRKAGAVEKIALTAEEKVKVGELKTLVGNDVEERFLVQVLCHRDWDVEKAVPRLEKYLNLRKEMGISSIRFSDFEICQRDGSMYWNRKAKGGAMLHVVLTRNVRTGVYPKSAVTAIFGFMVDSMLSFPHCLRKGAVHVGDLWGTGPGNMDFNLSTSFIKVMTGNVPIKWKKWIFYRPDTFGETIIKFMIPFMSAKMKDRVKLMHKPEELKEFLPDECISLELGGEGPTIDFEKDIIQFAKDWDSTQELRQ